MNKNSSLNETQGVVTISFLSPLGTVEAATFSHLPSECIKQLKDVLRRYV